MATEFHVKDHTTTHQCFDRFDVASQIQADAIMATIYPNYFAVVVPAFSSEYFVSNARFLAGDEAIAHWFEVG